MVDGEFMGDARSTIVCEDAEFGEVEVVHDGDAVFCHFGFGVGGMGGAGGRFGRFAIAAEIDGYGSVGGGELGCNYVPDCVGLGETVEEEEGWAGSAFNTVYCDSWFGLNLKRFESVKHYMIYLILVNVIHSEEEL